MSNERLTEILGLLHTTRPIAGDRTRTGLELSVGRFIRRLLGVSFALFVVLLALARSEHLLGPLADAWRWLAVFAGLGAMNEC